MDKDYNNTRFKIKQNIFIMMAIMCLLLLLGICFMYYSNTLATSHNFRFKFAEIFGGGNTTQNDDNELSNKDYGPYNLVNNTITDNEIDLINATDNVETEVTEADVKKLKFEENDEEFSKLSNLNIFNNPDYEYALGEVNDKLIYPGIQGTYSFQVENYSLKNITYKLKYLEDNPKNVNMMYSLKRNGKYIVGTDSQYVSINQMNVEGLLLESMKGDNYDLNWKWVDTDHDNDSTSNITRESYKLVIRGEV